MSQVQPESDRFRNGGENDRAPRRIAIVGGTHGNERGGIWVVEDMLRSIASWRRPGLDIQPLLANPRAALRNLRYLDRDLNRCFGPELANSSATHELWERRRALEIRDTLSARKDAPGFAHLTSEPTGPDLVVDLHNTTANMGVTWILTALDPWPLYLAAKAQENDPRVRILYTPESAQSNVFLPSLGKHEITLEIGPVPHGTNCHWAWLAARDHVRGILDRIASSAPDFAPSAALQEMRFEYFESLSVERYPLDENGRPCALIHSNVWGFDYQPLHDGAALFVDPATEAAIPYRGPTIYPVFVGEAAYVESGIAYHATRRMRWEGTRGEAC